MTRTPDDMLLRKIAELSRDVEKLKRHQHPPPVSRASNPGLALDFCQARNDVLGSFSTGNNQIDMTVIDDQSGPFALNGGQVRCPGGLYIVTATAGIQAIATSGTPNSIRFEVNSTNFGPYRVQVDTRFNDMQSTNTVLLADGDLVRMVVGNNSGGSRTVQHEPRLRLVRLFAA